MDTIALKKIGGSLYFKLPLSYRHKFDFEPGDLFHLIPNKDGTILKLVKADELEKSTVPNGQLSRRLPWRLNRAGHRLNGGPGGSVSKEQAMPTCRTQPYR